MTAPCLLKVRHRMNANSTKMTLTLTVFQWMAAGNTSRTQSSKQARVRELVPTNVRPKLSDDELLVKFIFTTSPDRLAAANPPLISKSEGIERSFDYHQFPKPTSSQRLSYSYNNDCIDPGAPGLPRGIICPNCSANNTAFAQMRDVKSGGTPIWNCMDKLVHERYPVNPCLACPVCQTHDPLMDRLWHRCESMRTRDEPARFLAPNYRDRGAEQCGHCGFSPHLVTCMCRYLV